MRAQRERPGELELLAAPVLDGPRYEQQPVYFSDVIVRADSPYHTLEDLAGETWAYNEESSHSGYNLVYASLLERGLRYRILVRTYDPVRTSNRYKWYYMGRLLQQLSTRISWMWCGVAMGRLRSKSSD